MSERSNDDAKYRGVRKRKWGKWVSEIRLPNSRERIWLGSYDSAEKAARAFDAALFCLRGNTANFNFPDQPPNIPGGTDLHPSQIQAVASHFANSYLPSTNHHDFQNPSDVSHHTSATIDHVVSSSQSSFLMDHQDYQDYNSSTHNNNNNIPDYGIFPGFDDYFMPMEPPSLSTYDYGEEAVYDEVYSQDPCCLWNF